MEVRPMTGDTLQSIILGCSAQPQDVRERVKVALQPKQEHTLEQLPGQPR
jgi:hypothetical protein